MDKTLDDLVLVVVLYKATSGSTTNALTIIHQTCKENAIEIYQEDELQSHDHMTAFKLLLHGANDARLRSLLVERLDQSNIEFMLTTLSKFMKPKKLVLFDVDGTLLDAECIDEIAREAGVMEKVAELTKKAMEQDWDFTQSLSERLSLVKDLHKDRLHNVWTRLELHEGVYSTIQCLKQHGYKVAMVSGGFTFFTDRIGKLLGFDYAFANTLEVEGEMLKGRAIPPIVDGKMKANVLEILSNLESIDLSETVAVGDGSNDRFMIQKAGLGVAFHAKSILKQSTDVHINKAPMSCLCYFLGLSGWCNPSSDLQNELTRDEYRLSQNVVKDEDIISMYIPLEKLLEEKY